MVVQLSVIGVVVVGFCDLAGFWLRHCHFWTLCSATVLSTALLDCVSCCEWITASQCRPNKVLL